MSLRETALFWDDWNLQRMRSCLSKQSYNAPRVEIVCSIFEDMCMGFSFQHRLIIISIFPKRNTGATFISSLHVLPETPLGSHLLSPLSWELSTSFVSRTHPDLSLWCPADSSLYKLPLITKQIQSSRQMLIKGYIKKAKHSRWTNSTVLHVFATIHANAKWSDGVLYVQHLKLFLRAILKISNTEKHPCDLDVREVGKHY